MDPYAIYIKIPGKASEEEYLDKFEIELTKKVEILKKDIEKVDDALEELLISKNISFKEEILSIPDESNVLNKYVILYFKDDIIVGILIFLTFPDDKPIDLLYISVNKNYRGFKITDTLFFVFLTVLKRENLTKYKITLIPIRPDIFNMYTITYGFEPVSHQLELYNTYENLKDYIKKRKKYKKIQIACNICNKWIHY